MDQFLKDVLDHIASYYDLFVAWTPKLVLGIITILAFYFLAIIIERVLKRVLMRTAEDPLSVKFIAKIARVLVLGLGLIATLGILGLGSVAGKILAGAGITAFALGFAFKDIGENFLAGIVLAFRRPFRIGDIIVVDGFRGTIKTLNLRDTLVKTFDGNEIFIPNSVILKNPLINETLDGYFRETFTLGIRYEDSLQRAREIILSEIEKEESTLSDKHEPGVIVEELLPSYISIKVLYWLYTSNPDKHLPTIKSTLLENILNRMTEENFELPNEILELRNDIRTKVIADSE